MMTYEEADALVGANITKAVKKTATYLRRTEDNIAVIYHNTAVVTITPRNTYILRSGGFVTRTTMMRIRQFSPIKDLHQKDQRWYFGDHREFQEGVEVDSVGKPINLV
jgi:hypothetical protein